MSAGNQNIGDGRSTLDVEMQAYDLLGPLTRKALSEARFQIGAASLLRSFVQLNADLTAPETDRAGARAIREHDAKIAFQLAMKDGRL